MTKLLIIDDDYSLFSLLAEYLGNSGFFCVHAPDGDSALAALAEESWDAVILDVMLPGKNGHEVLRSLRAEPGTSALPVLMLTARGEEDDKVIGFELGADDYLAKPFGARELVARLQALLRRTRRQPLMNDDDFLYIDELIIDKRSMTMNRGEERIEITASELRLMEIFSRMPGKVAEREMLYKEIFEHPPFAQDRSLDMMISRLRRKLGPRPDGLERIRAARGQGYMFLLSDDA